MLRKHKLVSLMMLVAILLSSTAVQASGYEYNQRNYTVNHSFYDSVSNQNYNYNWQVTTTQNRFPNWSRPETPSQPSRPSTPSRPNNPGQTDTPSQPDWPSKPEEEPSNPSTPNDKPETNTPSTPSVNTNLSQAEQEVVRLVNIEREKSGLIPFTISNELSKVARTKSEDMAQHNYFSHNSPTYGDPFNMISSFGIKYSTAGENIAKGYATASSVVRGWMNSSGHRANILNSSFKTIGVGAYTTSNGTIYWTQMFTN